MRVNQSGQKKTVAMQNNPLCFHKSNYIVFFGLPSATMLIPSE
jgi:hypothetical protein